MWFGYNQNPGILSNQNLKDDFNHFKEDFLDKKPRPQFGNKNFEQRFNEIWAVINASKNPELTPENYTALIEQYKDLEKNLGDQKTLKILADPKNEKQEKIRKQTVASLANLQKQTKQYKDSSKLSDEQKSENEEMNRFAVKNLVILRERHDINNLHKQVKDSTDSGHELTDDEVSNINKFVKIRAKRLQQVVKRKIFADNSKILKDLKQKLTELKDYTEV